MEFLESKSSMGPESTRAVYRARDCSEADIHASASPESVAILLGTYNGGRFLEEQLASIAAQTHANWFVVVSDDGSVDDTLGILETWRGTVGKERVSIGSGPARGFSRNFLALACDRTVHADYFAYCDQDDVWDADKLSTALAWLRNQPVTCPALYCARTRLIDEAGQACGWSPLFERPVGFRNALVQSVAGGNTMVFNSSARHLLLEAGADLDLQTHDWWTYLVVSACGGRVFYDHRPTVGYRQHDENLVGSNIRWKARAVRARKLVEGRFRGMNQRNLDALARLRHRIAPHNLDTLDRFCRARELGFFARLTETWRSGVYCQTRLGNLGLVSAALLRKF